MKTSLKSQLYTIFLEPSSAIRGEVNKRQVALISSILLAINCLTFIAILYMWREDFLRYVSRIILVAEIFFFTAYILSRTEYTRLAVRILLFVLLLIPIFNIALGSNHSEYQLLVLLIWNVATVMIGSMIASYEMTIGVSVINLATFAGIIIFIDDITLADILIPLMFNFMMQSVILIATWHRNQLEQLRMKNQSEVNEQLRFELVERSRIEKELQHIATHDALTGLPNRILLQDRLQHDIEMALRHSDWTYAVFFLDLNKFKSVNDTFGHDAGDIILVESAIRLKESMREQDTVCRLGGDEFVILVEDVDSREQLSQLAERILAVIEKPFHIDGKAVEISTSIGVAEGKKSYGNYADIIRDADIAMYRAKKRGQGLYEFYE